MLQLKALTQGLSEARTFHFLPSLTDQQAPAPLLCPPLSHLLTPGTEMAEAVPGRARLELTPVVRLAQAAFPAPTPSIVKQANVSMAVSVKQTC